MAISREEAIKKLTLIACCEVEMPVFEHCELMHQAISDIEKLQKIEEILNGNCFDVTECASCKYNYRDEDCISYRIVDLIGQIVKEVG